MEEKKKLEFRGGMAMSLIPVLIYVGFCVTLFIGFKAFNMEALAVGGNHPLSSSAEALRIMEAQRRPLYLAAADAVISNTGTLAEALAAAQEALDEIFDS